MLRVGRALELRIGLRAGLRAELQGGDPLRPLCALPALFHCVASTLVGRGIAKPLVELLVGLLVELLVELWQSFVQSFVQGFCRALVELSVLKFVTWILPQLTARAFLSDQSEAGLAGV